MLLPEELDRRRGSVGRPIGGMVVTVRGARRAPWLPDGEVGELYVAGPLVMQGYLDEPEMTAASLTPHGFRTGDFGHRDEAGFVWVAGRQRRHHQARRREGLARAHPGGVARARAVRRRRRDRRRRRAARPRAGGVRRAHRPGRLSSAPRSCARCAGALPATSLPSRVVALAEIPRTGSGKPIRPRTAAPRPEASLTAAATGMPPAASTWRGSFARGLSNRSPLTLVAGLAAAALVLAGLQWFVTSGAFTLVSQSHLLRLNSDDWGRVSYQVGHAQTRSSASYARLPSGWLKRA